MYRGHGVEKFVLDFDPEHTTPARVFRACLPWRAMVVCPESDRKVRRIFLSRRLYTDEFSSAIRILTMYIDPSSQSNSKYVLQINQDTKYFILLVMVGIGAE